MLCVKALDATGEFKKVQGHKRSCVIVDTSENH